MLMVVPGKTGSAETGQVIDGEKVVHAWFAGYFPKTNPKYSIVVFIEDGKVVEMLLLLYLKKLQKHN